MYAHADITFFLDNSKRNILPVAGINKLIPPNKSERTRDSILLKWDESATEFCAVLCDCVRFKTDRLDYAYVGNSF